MINKYGTIRWLGNSAAPNSSPFREDMWNMNTPSLLFLSLPPNHWIGYHANNSYRQVITEIIIPFPFI